MEREYAFQFTADAVKYLLALLDARPRGESNPIATAIEQARAQQDAEHSKHALPINRPQETWERVTNGLDRSSDALDRQEARQ